MSLIQESVKRILLQYSRLPRKNRADEKSVDDLLIKNQCGNLMDHDFIPSK